MCWNGKASPFARIGHNRWRFWPQNGTGVIVLLWARSKALWQRYLNTPVYCFYSLGGLIGGTLETWLHHMFLPPPNNKLWLLAWVHTCVCDSSSMCMQILCTLRCESFGETIHLNWLPNRQNSHQRSAYTFFFKNIQNQKHGTLLPCTLACCNTHTLARCARLPLSLLSLQIFLFLKAQSPKAPNKLNPVLWNCRCSNLSIRSTIAQCLKLEKVQKRIWKKNQRFFGPL